MKTVRFGRVEKRIIRENIARLGETVYHSSDVKSVMINIEFEDGSSIGFHREEDDEENNQLEGEK